VDALPAATTRHRFFFTAEVRKWFISYSIHVFGTDAKELRDGQFYDGMGYNPNRFAGVSLPRHDAWYEGKMHGLGTGLVPLRQAISPVPTMSAKQPPTLSYRPWHLS
jgi:hypothetical protein